MSTNKWVALWFLLWAGVVQYYAGTTLTGVLLYAGALYFWFKE